MKETIVSVIIPIYKVEKYIETCLDSLLNQSLTEWEAILVDDGSPDRSGDICEEYASKDSRFKVVHQKNGGQSSARNRAMNHVNGQFIFYLDSDDFIHPETLRHLVDLAKENEADIVQCDYIRGRESSFPKIEVKENIREYDNHTVFSQFAAKIIPWGKLYKREVIGSIRFPEGIINEDDFTTWKYYYNAPKIVITNLPFYYYTINPDSTMAIQQRKPNLNYFNAYLERIAFFEQSGEQDLEAVSRIQWMKSLVMLYSNSQLMVEERKDIKRLFAVNYQSKSLMNVTIPTKLSFVFQAFNMAPKLTSKIIKNLYKSGV